MDLSKYFQNEGEAPQEGGQKLSKEEYAAVKKQEREEVWAEIDAKAQDVFKDDSSLRGFLDFMAQCSPQRTANLLLLYSQNPEIRQVKTYEKWRQEGRSLRTDAQGYRFIAGQEYEKDGVVMQGYTIRRVYDISQIRMRQSEVPEPKPMDALLGAMLAKPPVPVQISDDLPQNVQAQYVPRHRAVYVRNGMSETATFHSINRELACAALDQHDGRYERRTVAAQAFCAAYVVAQKYGVDTSSFQFGRVCEMQGKGEKDPKELRAFIGDIRNAAYSICKNMNRSLGEQAQEFPEEFNFSDGKDPDKAAKNKAQPER